MLLAVVFACGFGLAQSGSVFAQGSATAQNETAGTSQARSSTASTPGTSTPVSPLEFGLNQLRLDQPDSLPDDRRLLLLNFLIEDWRKTLDRLRIVLIETPDLDQGQIDLIRQSALDVETKASDRQAVLRDEIADLQAQWDTLGPLPTNSGASIEAKDVRDLRKTIEARLQAGRTRLQQIDLIIERSNQIIDRVAEYQTKRIQDRLTEQFPSPLTPQGMLSAVRDLGILITQALNTPLAMITEDIKFEQLKLLAPSIAIATVAMALIALIGRILLYGRYGRGAPIENPSFPRRLLAALITVITRGVLPAAAIILPIHYLLYHGVITGNPAELLETTAETLGRLLFGVSLLQAAIAPTKPQWRLADISDDVATILFRRAFALLLILHLAVFVGQSANTLSASPQLLSLFVLVASGLFSLNLIALLRLRRFAINEKAQESDRSAASPSSDADGDDTSGSWLDIGFLIRLVLVVAAIATPLIAAAGYSRFSIFLMGRLLDAGLLVFSLFLVRRLVQDTSDLLINRETTLGAGIRRRLELGDTAVERLTFWGQIVIDILLFVMLVLGLSLIMGATPGALRIAALRTLEGVQIGSITLSPGAVVAALLGFIVTLIITRLLQRGLTRRIFPHTHIETGVRHSVNQAIGYGGMTIAILVAIAAAGIDLSNIALIAGALSVGIGFGLQAIVNNFVSGLILLAERPIKVGDWIRIGDHEGQVKRINVRSTEIQTFMRTDVIVPNSDLISNPVTNYTHKDRLGRLDFPVPVSFGADPDRVTEILMKIADDHPNVTKWPEPYVLFRGFGENTMQLELRVYLNDIWTYYFSVISDINFAIVREMRAAGIPFQAPYRDIRMVSDDPQSPYMVRATAIDPADLSEETDKPNTSARIRPGVTGDNAY
jgi:small-conductance mechanosensitive channel